MVEVKLSTISAVQNSHKKTLNVDWRLAGWRKNLQYTHNKQSKQTKMHTLWRTTLFERNIVVPVFWNLTQKQVTCLWGRSKFCQCLQRIHLIRRDISTCYQVCIWKLHLFEHQKPRLRAICCLSQAQSFKEAMFASFASCCKNLDDENDADISSDNINFSLWKNTLLLNFMKK